VIFVSSFGKSVKIFGDFSPDPTRLLLTFGANTSLQEKLHQNTALHWAIQTKNSTALSLLTRRNACLDIPNNDGETPLSLLKKINSSKTTDWVGKKTMEQILDKAEPKNAGWFQELKNDKVHRPSLASCFSLLCKNNNFLTYEHQHDFP
jgi:ankyrin repeat protein